MPRALLVMLALVALAASGLFTTFPFEPAPEPAPEPEPAAPAQVEISPRLAGITTQLTYRGREQAAIESGIARMRSVGVRWVRVQGLWSHVEAERGARDWSRIDAPVRAALCQGMRVVPVLWGAPAWAQEAGDRRNGPPRRNALGAWSRFVADAVARYGPGGSLWSGTQGSCANGAPLPYRPALAWQIWNEPNVSAFWGGREPEPRRFLALLEAAHEATRRQGVKLVSGGLTGDREGGAISFLRRLYAAPGLSLNRLVDGIDLHPYAPSARRALRLVRRSRRVIDEKGGRRLRLYLTEIGWATCAERGHSYTSRCRQAVERSTTETGQARRLRRFYDRIDRNQRRLRLGHVAWYSWSDYTADVDDGCSWCEGAGLLRADGSAKPAYYALRGLLLGKR